MDLAWARRDKKTLLPKLEEELMMESRRLLKELFFSHSPLSFDYKTIAQ